MQAAGNRKISNELKEKLKMFLYTEISDKVIDGITYALITKEDKNIQKIKQYIEIRKMVSDCGFENNEVFRVFQLPNGFIFDLDMGVAKKLTRDTFSEMAAMPGFVNIAGRDVIGDNPDIRRKNDMMDLANFIRAEVIDGRDTAEVALFSRNSVSSINLTVKDNAGNSKAVRYRAYAIRHWDIEHINCNILIPANIRISKIEPCEILPSQTGVRFLIYMETCK